MKKLMVLLLAALVNLTALPLHADLASLRFFLTHPKRWNVILDEEGRGKISRTEDKRRLLVLHPFSDMGYGTLHRRNIHLDGNQSGPGSFRPVLRSDR